jgi:glutamine synthetase
MAGNLDLATLKRLVASKEIDTVVVAFPDLQGRLVGKRFTGHFFVDSAVNETHACDYLLTVDIDMEPVPGYKAASWDKGYGDFALRSDLSTLRRIPWLPGTALVLADCVDHAGNLVPHAPRTVLKRQIERARKLGYAAKLASELEFYIFDESFETIAAKGFRTAKTAGQYIEDYHILQTTKEEPLVRAIRNGMDGAAIPVECSKGEWGPGQGEINLIYTDALEMADRHTIYKNGAKEIAAQQGKAITFMAKWDFGLAGSSSHIHSSLWDAKRDTALFDDSKSSGAFPALFRHYVAGQLAVAREMTYFLAPYINSYKRFQAGTFAPTKIAWSIDNRTSGFRVCGHGKGLRLECRIPGADCNPYLAYSAIIAAGLHGIEHKLEPEPILSGNLYESKKARDIPKTLREAVDALDKSKILRAALGDEVVDHYVHTGRWEQFEYDRRVTDWELRRGFERS